MMSREPQCARPPAAREALIEEPLATVGLTGQDLVCLSSIDWASAWQGHQELMARLAAQGNRVLFIENTGVRRPGLQDLPRIQQRLRDRFATRGGFRVEREGLVVFTPLGVPLPYSRLALAVNRALVVRPICRWLRAARCSRPVVWTYLPTPLAREVIRSVAPVLTVYYCADDLPASSPGARRLATSETEILRTADLVFVTAEGLQRRALRVRPDVHLFPAGVHYSLFERVRTAPGERPADLYAVRPPIAGYVGSLNDRVDQDLLCEVARRLPTVSFVFVGPTDGDLSRLSACPNVRILGRRPHPELPRYLKAFDVGLVPYRLTAYTTHIYPTKLNEYLAMGLPVVSVDLPEVRRFNAEHGPVVLMARGADEFARALQAGFEDRSPASAQRRVDVARRNDWGARLAEMSVLIARELAHRRASGLSGAGTPRV